MSCIYFDVLYMVLFWLNSTQYPALVWDEECTSTPSGEEYLGPVDRTDSLYKCQNWSKDYPHPHGYNDVGDHNKCRSVSFVKRVILL